MDENKVTIRFESNITDHNENINEEILFQGPIEIYRTVDNISSLYLLDVPDDRDVIVYVRNVINEYDGGESTTRKRSAFFLHSYSDNAWKEVLIGTHSHENKDILDQLGNIDIENLPIGTKKMLSIEQVDADGYENIPYAYQYKLSWEEYPKQLPEIPEKFKNTTVYLTVENGEYVWKEKIIPTQTFQYKQIIVESDTPTKTLRVPDLNYNKDDNDEILIFDNGSLLSDFTIDVTYESDHGTKIALITINSDNPNLIFEKGEKITILVIKNGVKGFVDSLAAEYMTKQDVIKFLSGGSITLANYVTKDQLKQKADVQHTHSQFALDGHNHDNLYASYYHIHNEYMRMSDVYGAIGTVLAELLGQDDPNLTQDDIDALYEAAIGKLREELLAEIDRKATIEYVRAEISDIKNNYLTTSKISVYGTPYVLSDYLRILEDKISNIEYGTSTINFSSGIKVNVGEGNSVGGFNSGDSITEGTTIHDAFQKLLTKRVEPEIKQPELKLTITPLDLYEPGDKNSAYSVKPYFIKNDAGDLDKIVLEIEKYREENLTSPIEITLNNNEDHIIHLNVYDGGFANIRVIAYYKEGNKKSDNLGKTDYFVPEGSIIAEQKIHVDRRSFVGKYLTSVRDAKMIETPTDDFTAEVKGYIDLHDIVFAFPKKDNIFISDIIYRNQGCQVLDLFDVTEEYVPGANGYEPIKYKVYKYHSFRDLDQTMYFDFRITEGITNE